MYMEFIINIPFINMTEKSSTTRIWINPIAWEVIETNREVNKQGETEKYREPPPPKINKILREMKRYIRMGWYKKEKWDSYLKLKPMIAKIKDILDGLEIKLKISSQK